MSVYSRSQINVLNGSIVATLDYEAYELPDVPIMIMKIAEFIQFNQPTRTKERAM